MFDEKLLCKAISEKTGMTVIGFYYYLPKANGFEERHYIIPLGNTKLTSIKVIGDTVRKNTGKRDGSGNMIFDKDTAVISEEDADCFGFDTFYEVNIPITDQLMLKKDNKYIPISDTKKIIIKN